MDDLELVQDTAYSYVNRLFDAGVVEVTHDEQPRRYAARVVDLTLITAAGDREYTITPALIGRRETSTDIDTYIDRHPFEHTSDRVSAIFQRLLVHAAGGIRSGRQSHIV